VNELTDESQIFTKVWIEIVKMIFDCGGCVLPSVALHLITFGYPSNYFLELVMDFEDRLF